MKSLVVSFLLVAVCLSIGAFADGHDRSGMKGIIRECAAERNIDPEELKAMMPPKDDEEKLKVYCVSNCAMEKYGTLIDNKVQTDKLKEWVSKMSHMDDERIEELKAKIDECAEEAHSASGECAVAGTFGQCFMPALHHKHHSED